MTTVVELLQQTGLNKYEAEGYYTLLSEGPLTGYELGKRSQVPLSRSYEILERLTQKGLALVQPGDPPRYLAEKPERYLGQVRSSVSATLDTLASVLADLPRADVAGEFWVLRGRQHILGRVRALIEGARHTIDLSLPASRGPEVAAALAQARARGCRLSQVAPGVEDVEFVLLLVDGHGALVGTLVPAERCQAVTSANRALIAPLSSYFARPAAAPAPSIDAVSRGEEADWLAWEERKQRRLWNINTGNRIA